MKNDTTGTALLVIAIVASLLVALFILALGTTGTMMGGGGMMGGDAGYGFSGTWLAILAVAVIVLIVSIVLLVARLSGNPESGAPSAVIPNIATQPVAMTPPEENRQTTDDHMISRLLDGDERNLYQMIASAGGSILQKDIVSKKVFSKAKVTRLLDKLEERELIVRERYGATNRIRIAK